MADTDRTVPNGHGRWPPDGDADELDEARILEAMEGAYEFPGYYPVVVIARRDLDFEAHLSASVAAEQGESPFSIRERPSRKGTYASYRIELFVETAVIALQRKAVLADLPGVIVLL